MKNKIFGLFAFSLLLGAPLSSCGSNVNENSSSSSSSSAASIRISDTLLTIEKFDSYQLTYTLKNSLEDVYWTIDNPIVASVNDGLVTGLLPGKATVSVHAGELVSSCDVTVVGPSQAALLQLSDDDIKIGNGSSYTIDVSTTYKGVEYPVEFAVEFGEGKAEDVIKYSTSAGKITLTALKSGSTELIVSASAFDTDMARTIAVEVI